MNLYRGMVVSLFIGLFALPQVTWAAAMNMSRRDIRQMPVVERPSRPGHFYGNTVRRQYHRRQGS